MRSVSTLRVGLALALLFALWSSSLATGKIAIDGLHGLPIIEAEVMNPNIIDLEALYPDIDFITFEASRMPIYEVLAEGWTGTSVDTIAVEVGSGVHALYVALDVNYSPQDLDQLPMLQIVGPDQSVTPGAYGMCHVDYPESGRYVVGVYWSPASVRYRIGTGPCIWEVYPPEDYDAVLNLLCHTWMLFRGTPTPYSSYDFARLQQMLSADGGHMLFYDGSEPIALKPIIHIRDLAFEGATIRIDIPGRLTYARPQPQRTRPLVWQIAPTNAESEYYYEGEFARPLNFVARALHSSRFINRSWAVVRDLKVIEFIRGEGYRIAEVGTLSPGEERPSCGGEISPYLTACRGLEAALRREALVAGMTTSEIESFFTRYSWAERVIAEACASNAPVCLYRLEGEDYHALFPMEATPEPADLCRVLWVYSILPDQAGSHQAVHPRVSSTEARPPERRVGMLHEYGFFQETYGGDALDDMDAWDWHFYDLGLIDPTNYVGWESNILFHTWGASPLVARFSEGVSQVFGTYTAGMLPAAGAAEVVLSGDDDTACEYPDSTFPPGSYPPVVVARQEATGGQLVGLADIHFLADDEDNLQFMRNIFDWMNEGATGEGPDIDLPVAVAETTMAENSMEMTHFHVRNLGDEALTLTTDLLALSWIAISGPSTIVIGPGGTVTYNLTWNSAGLSPGYYDTLWSFSSNDQNEPLLHWPVRLHVTSGSATEEPSRNAMPGDFALLSVHPNPFNGQVGLSFAVPRGGVVLFDLYNVLGQHVERLPVKEWAAGTHQLLLNLTGKPAGLYFLRGEYGGNVRIHKLMLVN